MTQNDYVTRASRRSVFVVFFQFQTLIVPKFAISQSEAVSCPDIIRHQVTDPIWLRYRTVT